MESNFSLKAVVGLVNVVRLKDSGDFVPADVKLVSGYLELINEAFPLATVDCSKSGDDSVYSGSTIKHGESNGVVTSIGLR